MASVYRREGSKSLWGKWTDAAGSVGRASLKTEDEALAQARADELERQARGGTVEAPAAAPGELTVEAFANGEWLALRKQAMPLAWKDDVSRFEHHLFPTFGSKPLAWLATDDGVRAVFSWAVGLRAHKGKRDGKPIAPRTCWNIYSSAKVLLDDAVELRRLKFSPLASFNADKHLPEKRDKVDGWREGAGFELDQVAALTTDSRLLPHRRILNTLAFLTGGRTGEVANLRWRDLTQAYKGQLDRLVIASSYNTRSDVEKDTKTGAKKWIPVHPFAGRALAAWYEAGWEEWMGRAPKLEDFIVPRSDGKQWRNWQLLDQFHADLDILGIPRQRQYENRSTFRMLLFNAGAPDFIVDRMTHPSPKQASDWYTRTDKIWPAMCDAIRLLNHHSWRAPEPSGPGGERPLRVVGAMEQRAVRPGLEKPSPAAKNSALGNRRSIHLSYGGALEVPADSAPDGFDCALTVPMRTVALPGVTPDLFLLAAANLAQQSPDGAAELLRRGLAQAGAL